MADPQPNRVYKAQHPKSVLISAAAIGVVVIVVIIFAITYTTRTIQDARMVGTVIEKNFIPLPERQVTIGRDGLRAEDRAGNFQIRVRVPQRTGEPREFFVDNLPEDRWNELEIGDTFEVGPFLAPGQDN